MGVTVLHHYNIVTDKIDESVKFYEDVIGLKKGDRPELPDPGAWLYLDETPVVHLLQLGEHRGDHTGPIDHVAFQASDYEGFAKSLKANGPGVRGELHRRFRSSPGVPLRPQRCEGRDQLHSLIAGFIYSA